MGIAVGQLPAHGPSDRYLESEPCRDPRREVNEATAGQRPSNVADPAESLYRYLPRSGMENAITAGRAPDPRTGGADHGLAGSAGDQ